jgi:hypothetical protein
MAGLRHFGLFGDEFVDGLGVDARAAGLPAIGHHRQGEGEIGRGAVGGRGRRQNRQAPGLQAEAVLIRMFELRQRRLRRGGPGVFFEPDGRMGPGGVEGDDRVALPPCGLAAHGLAAVSLKGLFHGADEILGGRFHRRRRDGRRRGIGRYGLKDGGKRRFGGLNER